MAREDNCQNIMEMKPCCLCHSMGGGRRGAVQVQYLMGFYTLII